MKMKTTKTTPAAKNANATKSAKGQLKSINLDKVAGALEFTPLSKNAGVRKESEIYNYPETWKQSPFNKENHGKEFRNATRNKRDRMILAFIWANQQKDAEAMHKATAEFLAFYKATYKKNDFTIASITNHADGDRLSSKLTIKDAATFLSYLKANQGK